MATASIKNHFLWVLDAAKKMPSTLILLTIAVFNDIALDGSWLFSLTIFPVLFLFGVVRAIGKRESVGLSLTRVLLPVVAGLLVFENSSLQSRIAKANADQIIQACERFHEANGVYPKQLEDLVPHYLGSIPRAKYCCSYGQFTYIALSGHTLSWYEWPPYHRRVYNFEPHEWRYID